MSIKWCEVVSRFIMVVGKSLVWLIDCVITKIGKASHLNKKNHDTFAFLIARTK